MYFSGSLRNILQCFNQVSLTLGAGVGAPAEQLAIPRNLGTREWCCLDPQEGPGSTASAFKTAAVHIKTSILILPIPQFPSIIPILANIHSTHSTPPPITKSQSSHPQVPRSPGPQVPSPQSCSSFHAARPRRIRPSSGQRSWLQARAEVTQLRRTLVSALPKLRPRKGSLWFD